MGERRNTNPIVLEELEGICESNNGLLLPENVVSRAKSSSSPLHGYFEWDDTEAARKFRLVQARELIRSVYVDIKNPDTTVECRQVFVHLTQEREGGYRRLEAVVSDEDMRRQWVRDCLTDMQVFIRKYEKAKELSSLVSNMRRTVKKVEKELKKR